MSKFFDSMEKDRRGHPAQPHETNQLEQRNRMPDTPSPYLHQYSRNRPEMEYVYSGEGRESGFREYWKMLQKHRRLVLTGSALVFLLGMWWTLSKTPLFTATALLKIEPRTPIVMQAEDRVVQTREESGPYDYYKTQFILLKSRPLAARVITDLQLVDTPVFRDDNKTRVLQQWASSFFVNSELLFSRFLSVLPSSLVTTPASPVQREYTFGIHPRFIAHYLSLLEVKPVEGTRLVEVQFTSPDPVLSQKVANTHASAFIQTTLETRFDLTKEARDFLEKKLAELRTKVQNAEVALNSFRQTRGVVSLEGNENIVIERMIDVNRRLTDATAKRIEMESLLRMTEKKEVRELAQIIDNPLIQQLKATLATQEGEQARLATLYTAVHPRSVEQRLQINHTRRRLDGEVTAVVRKIASDYAAAQVRETTLQQEAQRQQYAALKFKQLGADYAFLKEDADSSRALYERVLKRLHETSIASEGAVSNIEVSELADIPLKPSSPKIGRDLMLFGFASVLFGMGLAFFRNYSDSTVGTPEDVWRIASSPTLGMVPSQRAVSEWSLAASPVSKFSALRWLKHLVGNSDGTSSHELVTSHHPLSLLTECYRNICARLLYSSDERSPQVILVTSAHPGDGKTVTTLNVALTLAQSGRKVVVVDADVRRGRCHTVLHKDSHPGLTTVLVGDIPLPHALQTTSVPGLSFLACGFTYPASPFFLGSPQMQDLVETLREQFEFVLIDSPPAIVVSDAIVLARLCDGVLMVIHGQNTSEESARRLVMELELVKAPILGVVLNGVDFSSAEYAEYRRYTTSTHTSPPPDTAGPAPDLRAEGSL